MKAFLVLVFGYLVYWGLFFGFWIAVCRLGNVKSGAINIGGG
jgi:hypothetical protein